jgi:hypothetical protein
MKIKFSEAEFGYIMNTAQVENKSAVRVVRDCINRVINQNTYQKGSIKDGSSKQ